MLDHEKNKQGLHALGIAKVREMIEIFGSDAGYFTAMEHEWQLEMIDEGLERGDEPEDIARQAGVCIKTVLRRKTKKLRGKS